MEYLISGTPVIYANGGEGGGPPASEDGTFKFSDITGCVIYILIYRTRIPLINIKL